MKHFISLFSKRYQRILSLPLCLCILYYLPNIVMFFFLPFFFFPHPPFCHAYIDHDYMASSRSSSPSSSVIREWRAVFWWTSSKFQQVLISAAATLLCDFWFLFGTVEVFFWPICCSYHLSLFSLYLSWFLHSACSGISHTTDLLLAFSVYADVSIEINF